MNKHFGIICSVIGLALGVLSVLGLSSLGMYEKGLRAERQQDFMDVAKKISFDVKKKIDAFLRQEQRRPYTDYQLYFVPESSNRATAFVQSPLANTFSNGLATGYFQLESDSRIVSPYFQSSTAQTAQKSAEHTEYFDNIRKNLLPSLQNGQTLATHRIEPTEQIKENEYSYDKVTRGIGRGIRSEKVAVDESSPKVVEEIRRPQEAKKVASKSESLSKSKGASSKRSVYPISTLKETQQTTQVLRQSRDNYIMNVASNEAVQAEEAAPQSVRQRHTQAAQSAEQQQTQRAAFGSQRQAENEAMDSDDIDRQDEQFAALDRRQRQQRVDYNMPAEQDDTVQVRIEPFVPMTVLDSKGNNGIFAGQVFLLRHVQIEDRHIIQGFQLNEDELLSQVAESTRGLLRRGMGYEISKQERPDAAFAAILQFDFGELVLNLLELDQGFIQAQVLRIRNWFFGILGVVWLAVLVAMAALWKNMHEQVQLSRKKDDFISAVSHELRTPLTSIRMYTEMLEKDWVKTDDKRREYYTTMRQESERLSRLIENVLDFSRIQRGKKRYDFLMGDINVCVREVCEMMQPYIQRAGFVLKQDFAETELFAFDRDAIVQIIINLVDNALKYAKDAEDKQIILRTRQVKNTVLIEIEDHGPGIPRNRQKKIFDAFYRCEDESTRQSTGTGLGLALVKRFAEAHRGFVEIANAKPTGALFRIGLTMQ